LNRPLTVGSVYARGLIDKDLAGSSFGFYACRYWEAAKAYIQEERNREGGDTTLFANFEALAKSTRLPVDKLDIASIHRFLVSEIHLSVATDRR